MFALIFYNYIQINGLRLHEKDMIKTYLSHRSCLFSRRLLLPSDGATGNQSSFWNYKQVSKWF